MASINRNWTTERLEALERNFKKTGVVPEDNPYYKGKIGRKKSGLNWGWTRDELLELMKCEADVIYFANNYAKILTKKGRKFLREVGGLRDYQIDLLRQFQNNRYNIVLASRQIGKSITVAIYIAWYIMFHDDANMLLLSETGAKAKDLLTKIKEIQDALPFFMQQGLVNDATQKRVYDNGCTLMSENTTENTGVSGSYEFVYWDEMALLDAEMQKKIFTGIFPTMASFGDKAKFIITSTPRGRKNKFYQLWEGAISEPDSRKYNGFAFSKVYWYQVEGRDEKWADNERTIMGDDGFAREYDLSFDVEEDMLIEDEIKKLLNIDSKTYLRTTYFKNNLRIRPNYDVSYFSDPDRKFHISIDLSGGKRGDYTVFNIFEIVKKPDDILKTMEFFESEKDFYMQDQVAIIRSNKYKPEVMAKWLYELLDELFDVESDNVKLTIETNHKGGTFISKLMTYGGVQNFLKEYREQLIIQYPRHCDFELNTTFEEGIMQTSKSKKSATDDINRMLSEKSISITEEITIDEGTSFGLNKKGNYEGLGSNDDCFMTVLNATHFFKTDEFEEWVGDLWDKLYPDERDVMENLLERVNEFEEDPDDIY
jgi:hypothetical protein